MSSFQRENSKSNSHVGKDFEEKIQICFKNEYDLDLNFNYSINIGLDYKKNHKFDLGSNCESVIIECKSHKWTKGNKVPSAKLTIWNEAMYYFLLAPDNYRKIFCVLKDYSDNRGCTLAEYYIRNFNHLIPRDVEIWEYDYDLNELNQLKK